MPFPIEFHKDKALALLDCLRHGKPIPPARTPHDFAALAGACHFAALSHGPLECAVQGVDVNDMHDERRELHWEGAQRDLTGAIEFYSHLTMMVEDGKYDQKCEPVVVGIVRVEDDGTKTVLPGSGFKEGPATVRQRSDEEGEGWRAAEWDGENDEEGGERTAAPGGAHEPPLGREEAETLLDVCLDVGVVLVEFRSAGPGRTAIALGLEGRQFPAMVDEDYENLREFAEQQRRTEGLPPDAPVEVLGVAYFALSEAAALLGADGADEWLDNQAGDVAANEALPAMFAAARRSVSIASFFGPHFERALASIQ